ncbi:hypothetical protein J6590_041379 [Homalodisca vitripennis]|nr:hypothetical protein J6590_041379 [Homalodisca vitripennis]
MATVSKKLYLYHGGSACRLQSSNPHCPEGGSRGMGYGGSEIDAPVTIRGCFVSREFETSDGKSGKKEVQRGGEGLFDLLPIKECGERTTLWAPNKEQLHMARAVYSAHWITATGLAGHCGDEPRSVAHASCSAQCTLDNGYRISRSLR